MSGSRQDITTDALNLISHELSEIFASAGRTLEKFETNQDDVESLEEVVAALHSACGALRMAEVHGAALLAEEMVTVTQALHARKVPNIVEGLEALSRALLQMPTYLERVAGGGHDVPLILLPLLNDLRAVRGHPLLSESSLFVLNADRTGMMPERPQRAPEVDIRVLAHKLRAPYQTALLSWLRGVEPEQQLETLSGVAAKFESSARTPLVFQTWWVLGGIVEAIVDGGLRPSASIKRLLGQGDRQIKFLAARGEDAEHEREVSEAFLNNLLYYVGRATADGERVTAIRQAYGLESLRAPTDSEGQEAAAASLSAPSVKLMKTVGAAIRQDLADVKDAIDIFVRTGETDRTALGQQSVALTKISDTLSVLGLGNLAEQMAHQSKSLTAYAKTDEGGDETLMAIASVLIGCETALEEQLLQRVTSNAIDPATQTMTPAEIAAQTDRRDVVEAVLRECVYNLTKIKDSLSQLVMRPEHGGALDEVPNWLRGIEAGLLMLEKRRAMEQVAVVGWHVQQLREHGLEHMGGEELDRLADAIVSIEYYMDTLRKGRRDPDYMLDNAESCLQSLSRQPPEPTAEEEEEEAETAAPVSAPAETTVAAQEPATATPPPPIESPLIADLENAVVSDARVHVDPELLELFIEEAKEEISNLQRQLPRWRETMDNRERLLNIRRSYHTLKGSGRMVGARVLAEFAWSIEELLNAVINQDVSADETLHSMLHDAESALPQLVEQLEVGTLPQLDINAIVARCAVLLGRQPAAAESEPAAQAAPVELPQPELELAAETEEIGLRLDPVLLDIFRKETQGHLDTIDAFVADALERGATPRVDESLHRAWHTLRGSANMAAVQSVVGIAEPVNEFLRSVMHDERRLGAEALDTVARSSAAIASIVASINTGADAPDHSALIDRINALQPELTVETPAPVVPSEPEQADVGFDPEVAAIFAEEAEEILDACDPSLNQWLVDAQNAPALADLLRHLHTLKGGARMAGVQSMATLSHELESVFEAMNAGELHLTDQTSDILRLGFDRLHVMQELLAAQSVPPAAQDVIAQLHSLSGKPAENETAAAEHAAAERAEAERAEAERAEAERAEAERAEAEHAEAERAEAERAEAERAEAERAEAERAEAERAEAERAEAERAEAERAEAERAEAERAEAARQDVADMASEMAQLVEDLSVAGDVESALPESSPEEDFAARLAAVTQAVKPEAGASIEPPGPASLPAARPADVPERPTETARVDAKLLDDMLNNAGEVSIFQSRIEQEMSSIGFNLAELSQTVVRLRDQLRQLDAETEAQIRYRHQDEQTEERDEGQEFDPLELDRYSTIQQLSRALGESVSDLVSIQDLLSELTRESENLLVQQSRVTTELQDSLIRTRMLPFSNFTPRLERVVRSAARDMSKRVNVTFRGESGELDRQVLQRMMPAFEHLLRNAVAHGIETPAARRDAEKEEAGNITVLLQREGTEMAIRIRDDGAGLDIDRIRRVAAERGLIGADEKISNAQALSLILEPGFSTAKQVTQDAGRGVGMDVVANEIKLLGGSIAVDSTPGKGTEFVARLPLTLAVTQALLVRCADDQFAIPLPAVEGIVRVPRTEAAQYLADPSRRYSYGAQNYKFEHLGRYVGSTTSDVEQGESNSIPVILVRAGDHSTALIADDMVGSREVVVKSVGPLVSGIPGVAGATILGDGSIVMILDVATLVRRAQTVAPVLQATARDDARPLILVVDDSITVRRVTQRLLERNDMRVLTAKDGVDAVSIMAETVPDLVLLDIEMPRMDGYEVSTHIRNSDQLRHLPIIMVTSRTGDKHRSRAFELGVDGYLGKPYQESQLLDAMRPLLTDDEDAQRGEA
ncbi:MAG: Hpt domain-containing protein [Gammaproteobacteria bacterium]